MDDYEDLLLQYGHLINKSSIKFDLNELQGNGSNSSGNSTLEADETYARAILNYYLMGIAGMIICCLGVVGNVLSVIVLTRRVMNSSSTYSYLAALAVCDTLVLLLTILILLRDTKRPEKGAMLFPEPYYSYMFVIVHPAAITFQVTSIWLTLAFTVDRYIMICHPFSAEKMCNVSRARKVILSMFIMGAIFNIPRWLEYRTKEFQFSYGGTAQYRVLNEFTAIGGSKLFRELVHSWLYLICVCGIPFLTLAVLNSFLIHAVHMSKKKGKQINAKEKKRNDTTVMLIGVIVIFLICQGPALFSRMIWAFNMKLASSMPFHVINEVSNFLVIINSAINIVPYYFFGQKFRREFWRLFCACFLDKDELRKLTRSLSLSIDNRRVSVASNHVNVVNGTELNGMRRGSVVSNGYRKDSMISTPLIANRDPRDSLVPQYNVETNAETDETTTKSSTPVSRRSHRSDGSPVCSLRVSWEMDSNKNEKYNVTADIPTITVNTPLQFDAGHL